MCLIFFDRFRRLYVVHYFIVIMAFRLVTAGMRQYKLWNICLLVWLKNEKINYNVRFNSRINGIKVKFTNVDEENTKKKSWNLVERYFYWFHLRRPKNDKNRHGTLFFISTVYWSISFPYISLLFYFYFF